MNFQVNGKSTIGHTLVLEEKRNTRCKALDFFSLHVFRGLPFILETRDIKMNLETSQSLVDR
jgi:hypothetical protein